MSWEDVHFCLVENSTISEQQKGVGVRQSGRVLVLNAKGHLSGADDTVHVCDSCLTACVCVHFHLHWFECVATCVVCVTVPMCGEHGVLGLALWTITRSAAHTAPW